jgi:hypothetical protein
MIDDDDGDDDDDDEDEDDWIGKNEKRSASGLI